MAYLRTKVLSHTTRVRAAYKKSCRAIETHLTEFDECDWTSVRGKQLDIRAKYDLYKGVQDMREAKWLLVLGEQIADAASDVFGRMHIIPADEVGGITHRAMPHVPDWIFDTWHPMERAVYPDFFAKRHQRKLEYVDRWHKKYGKPTIVPDYFKAAEGTYKYEPTKEDVQEKDKK